MIKLNSWGIKKVKIVPDALFSFEPKEGWSPPDRLKKEINFNKPYICLGGGSGLRSRANVVKWDVYSIYSKLIDKLRRIVPQIIFVDGYNGRHCDINRVIQYNDLGKVNLNNCSYRELFQVLKRSKLFISGRYHNSILSSMGGTPILLFGSDSYKTEGLNDLLDYNYGNFDINELPLHLDDVVQEAKMILKNEKKIRKELLDKTKDLKEKAYENIDF